jgi:hypothetical protein
MSTKAALLLTTALGLTALVATTVAQQSPGHSPDANSKTSFFSNGQHSPFSGYGTTLAPQYRSSGGAFYSPSDAESTKLAHESEQCMHQLAEAKSDSEKEKLKSKLGEILDKQFDVRQKHHETEIAALEAQVKKLRDLVQKRNENRREIVSKRLDQMLRDSQGLGW